MGIEYQHALVVEDLTWQPTAAHAKAIEAVMKKYGFTAKGWFAAGSTKKAKGFDSARPDAVLRFGALNGAKAAAITGPSQYDAPDDERYIQGAELHLGMAFKVPSSGETFQVTVKTPPMNGKTKVARSIVSAAAYHEWYAADAKTTPPKTDRTRGWPGVWRSGVLIDCGKDLPASAEDEDAGPLANRAFVDALAKAFGTKLVEFGWIY
ncbi:MAG: hypothetical protein QM831_42935 [Kofleriaceae bacterium]